MKGEKGILKALMSNFSEKLGQCNCQKGQKRPPTYIKDHFQRKLGQYYAEYRAKRKVQKTLMSKLNENKVSAMDRKDRKDLVHVLDPKNWCCWYNFGDQG